jgi:hypothetical protein
MIRQNSITGSLIDSIEFLSLSLIARQGASSVVALSHS